MSDSSSCVVIVVVSRFAGCTMWLEVVAGKSPWFPFI